MKIRQGFVSNSSSSSFVIVAKDGELTQEKIMAAFDVKEGSPLYTLAKGISNDLINFSREMPKQEYMDCYGYSTDEEFEENEPVQYAFYQDVERNSWKVYEGSVDSYEYPTLCELELYYEDDNIKIEKEGGY